MRHAGPLATAIAIAGLAPLAAAPSRAQSERDVPEMAALDANGSGTADRDEAHIAAYALWSRIDPDTWLQTEALHNQPETLKDYQLLGRLEGADYAAANLDSDHGITRAELLGAVDVRFAAADADHDGGVSAAEFGSDAGKKLLTLLQF